MFRTTCTVSPSVNSVGADASSRGLGYLLQFAQSTYNAALTIALILIIMTFVLVLFAVAERFERRLLAWRYL